MPIPGDNGNPRAERDAQNKRITIEAERGALVQKEVNFNPPAPPEKNVFGVMHK